LSPGVSGSIDLGPSPHGVEEETAMSKTLQPIAPVRGYEPPQVSANFNISQVFSGTPKSPLLSANLRVSQVFLSFSQEIENLARRRNSQENRP
jgi:hypothetical protein